MLLTCSCFAAEKSPIAISWFLTTAENDETLIYQNEKISFLKQSSSNTPFLNEVEFRTKIDKFESDRQSYAIRLKPNGWGEARDGEIVYHTTLKYNQTQRDLLLNNALKKRYDIVLDYLHHKQMIVLNEALLILHEERMSVLKQSTDDINFNLNELIDAENDMIQSELNLINLKNAIVNIEDKIRRSITVADAILFDTGGMIGIGQIERMVESINMAEEHEHVHLEEARLNWELAGAMYRLEQSESRRYLTFIEAAYNMDNRYEFDKSVSIEFGISIPIVNPNRLDTNRRTLNTLKAVSDYANLKREMTEKTTIFSRDIKRLISQYKVLQEKKEGSRSQSSLDIYRRMSGVSPLVLLKLKESVLKTDIAIQKITHQIYEKYLNFLDISGKLSEKPLRNYLSDNSEVVVQ
jgi:hypothetical protein